MFNPLDRCIGKRYIHSLIRHFEHPELLQAEQGGRFQWRAALGAGLIPGLVLMLVPRGSPWSGLSVFAPVIMGRALPAGWWMPLPVMWLLHMAIGEVYGLVISLFVQRLTRSRAALAGMGAGLGLYLVNLAVVSVLWPAWRGNESAVLFTHAVFGLIAGASYRGLLRRHARPGSD